jgi:SAM-dependent methyltransferase
MSILEHNRQAWNQLVDKGDRWTVPVSSAAVDEARQGRFQILLTPSQPVPAAWFPKLRGLDVLCLASGGGQQGPILAAAGAQVTVFDNSPRQAEQDRKVAEREGLSIRTVEGDMADLGTFAEASFDLIVHPVSNLFVPDVRPVWKEAYRVLRPGGALLSGFANPALYLFDYDLADRTGVLQVKYALPYSDLTSPTAAERQRNLQEGAPLEFSHTLQDQIGGQIEVGFVVTGFYEDADPNDESDLLGKYMSTFIATRAVKMRGPGGVSGRHPTGSGTTE